MGEYTQIFRLAGATEEISCDHINGQTIIYWEEIKQVFPGVKHVKNGNVSVKLLRDSNENRIVPFRIKHYPGVVLDVVSSSDESTSAAVDRNRSTTRASMEEDVESLQVTQLPADISGSDDRGGLALSRSSSISSHPGLKRGSWGSISFDQITTLAKKTTMESEIEQQLVSSLPPDLQAKVRASTNVREALIKVIKKGLVRQPNEQLIACLEKLDDKMMENIKLASKIMDMAFKNNELASEISQVTSHNQELLVRAYEMQKRLNANQGEMRRLQIQALDRLALIQKSAQALFTQTYELHEYPIPRLFIVLPQDNSSWHPLDHLSNKFRLYFLCECGEHTKSTNSRIPHHIHLAKHGGYEIAHPKEFFRRYGSYILTILQMLKHGIAVVGVAVPVLSRLIPPDALDQVTEGLKSLKNDLEPGMDQVIGYIEKISADKGQEIVGLTEQMNSNEALEGADLRQLLSFLKNKDTNRVHGNLYRTVTSKGHVKWVCIDHYRENYHDKAAKSFHETVETLRGVFDENIGRVEVRLESKLLAEQFYHALEKSRSVYELKLHLAWNTAQSDFKQLRDTLSKTSVGVLEIDLDDMDGPVRDILYRNQRYDPILGIMRHPSIQSFAIRGPLNLSEQSKLLSRNDDFSNLRHLDISLEQLKDDIPSAKHLIRKVPNLSSLAIGTRPLGCANGYTLNVYSVIAERWTYPINFKVWNRTIAPPPRGSEQAMTTEQCMEHFLKLHCECAGTTLYVNELDESTVDTIAKATRDGSAFKELELTRDGRLGESFIHNISSIVAQSELHRIEVYTREEEGRVRILDSIQWKHLRDFEIRLKPGTFETSVMRALVDSVKKMPAKVEMEKFWFLSDSDTPMTFPQGDLLQVFVASVSFEWLTLQVTLTVEQLLLLFRSTNFSRLEILKLWAKGFDAIKVDALLDGLQEATKLIHLHLLFANITGEQKSRMRAKGVILSDSW